MRNKLMLLITLALIGCEESPTGISIEEEECGPVWAILFVPVQEEFVAPTADTQCDSPRGVYKDGQHVSNMYSCAWVECEDEDLS